LEIEILRDLHHPGICRLREVIGGPSDAFLVLDFIPNGTLLTYCQDSKKALGEATARAFILDIICTVQYLHDNNIVHRDLKLDNCLVDNDWRVCIADFGLAIRLIGDDLLGTHCGTLEYAAPEVFWGTPYAGRPADVWSIGVILFALVTGKLPFLSPQDTVNVKYSWPRHLISNDLRHLLTKIFVEEPMERITLESLKRHQWFI
jgi:serine/threonine protein kinase